MDLLPLSKSRYAVWAKCPWRAAREYYDNIKPKPGPAAALGKTIHDLRHKVLTNRMNFDMAVSRLTDKNAQDLLVQSIAMDEYENIPAIWEMDICFNDTAGITKLRSKKNPPIGRAILDRIIIPDLHTMIVEDLKTGRWVYDDEFERNLYVLAAVIAKGAMYDIEFCRVYPATKQTTRWHYNKLAGTNYFDYHIKETGEDINLWTWYGEKMLEVALSEPIPTPGDDCFNWYGNPCYFLDKHCPASIYSPVDVSGVVKKESFQYQALEKLKYAETVADLDEATVSSAYHAVMSMESFVKDLKDKIKRWCEVGENKYREFHIGRYTYGFNFINVGKFDRAKILQYLMDQGMNLYDIAPGITISKSSLVKVNPIYRKHAHFCLEKFVSDHYKYVFGEIKEANRESKEPAQVP